MRRREALRHLSVLAAAGAVPWRLSVAEERARQSAAPEPQGAIHLNQAGYLRNAAKMASVVGAAASSFRVVGMGGEEVFHGSLTDPKHDAASGDLVAVADFSALTLAGTYRLEVAGLQSDSFAVGPEVYRRALYLSTRAFYGQRCGCNVDLGDGYRHPVCHKDGAYHPTSGRAGKAKHLGGWHDAGDYGRYVVNSGISTATLMYAFEMYPQMWHSFWLDIPRHHRHLPDLLAEVRWNLDWMISLQDRGGGVWHKQTSEQFCAFIMPQADALTSYVIGSGHAPFKTTAATADLAATAAVAARVFKPFDRHYAEHCLEVARKAWLWAIENPKQTFTNPAGIGTGGYDDPHLGDELVWASGELFRTTGEPEFEAQFLQGFTPTAAKLQIPEPGWGSVFALGCYAYASSPQASPQVRELILTAFAGAAAELKRAAGEAGYGNTLRQWEYFWGSNGACANQSLLLLLADRLMPDAEARAAAMANLHYLLGRNCHGVSWVTHVGARPFLHPHHRPSAADGILEPWPGLLSGGPNRHPGDEAARTLPAMPAMRMWLDDERAYSMNEVAINWNAPLVFLLTAANS